MEHLEKVWTTREIFESFDIPETHIIKTSGQYVGGLLIMQKCDSVVKIFKDCLETIRNDQLLITDHYNNKNQDILPYNEK